MPKAKSAPKKKILLFQLIEAIFSFTNLNLDNIADKAFGYPPKARNDLAACGMRTCFAIPIRSLLALRISDAMFDIAGSVNDDICARREMCASTATVLDAWRISRVRLC
jgi:hypothetical protein